MAKFNKLDIPHQWKDEFTKYPHGYTIFEALCKWVKQVDNMVDNQNNWNDYLDNFVENFEFELQEEVQSTIERWQSEGLLDDIIGNVLNTEINNVMAQLEDTRNEMQKFKGHTNSDEAVTNLLNIGLSYVDRPLIWYGQEGTLVSKNNTGKLWEGTHYLMDCSSFVEGVLRGITYENSAYLNDGVNYPIQNGFYYDDDFPRLYDRLLANEQAKYCTEKGWAYEANDDFSNVHIGDLVFIPGATNPDFFRQVGHIGFVLDVGQNSNITVLEMGNAQGKSDHESGADVNPYGKGWLKDRGAFFGRIPLKESKTTINSLLVSKINDTQFRTANTLYTRKIYTAIFESPISAGYFSFGSSTTNIYYNFFNHIKRLPNKKYKATFVIPSHIDDVSRIIRFYALDSPVDGIVTDLQLFDGVVTNYESQTTKEDILVNENGTAIRLENGLMFCYHTLTTVNGVTNPIGNIFTSDSMTWTFPASFISADAVFVTADSSMANRWATITTTPTATSVNIQALAGASNTTNSNIKLFAMGRWK